MSGRPRGEKLGRDYERWKGLTREHSDLAKKRIRFLMTDHILISLTLEQLLANAWLQGLSDGAEALRDRLHPPDAGQAHPASVSGPVPEGLG